MGSLELEDSCIGSCMSGDVSGTLVYHLLTSSGRTPYLKNSVALSLVSFKNTSS